MNEDKVSPVERVPFFYDVTLRDGNQALPKPWNNAEKEEVFLQLLRLGVQGIEVGFAAASDMDFESCKGIAELTAKLAASGDEAAQKVVVASLARCNEADIQKAWDAIQYAPRPRIHTFLATSKLSMEHVLKMTPAEVKAKAVHCVRFAKSLVGDRGDVQFSAEHFGDSHDNMDFVLDVLQAVVEAGATTINLPNTVERYRPMLFVNQVKQVADALPKHIRVAVHCHNDLGMATAATVESYFVGATQLEVALNGLGERCGNTNAYEVAVALYNSGVPMPLHLERIYETALLISQWSGIAIYSRAPLIGSEAIVHRSGIHQDGASKTKGMKKGAYRPIDYALIGRNENDSISFTSQSGRTAVYEIITSFGYHLSLEEAAELQPVLKEISEKEGELSAERVLEVFREKRCNVNGRLVFESIDALTEKNRFSFRFKKDGESKEVSISAEGPIEACLKLMQEIGFPVELLKYRQLVVPEADKLWAGRGLSRITLKAHGKTVEGRGVSGDTLKANMRAIFSGVNLLYP
ncbi:MAG: 2-isopropylmalate synthase [Fibrobacter sp.]|jgi:2-isopropylmalate synthase|nr:2-isopropylmalate synthase [Fibrobacter sp.]